MSIDPQAGALAIVVAGLLYQWWRDGRQRRWLKEDQAQIAKELAAVLSAKVAVEAARVAIVVEDEAKRLVADIAANTEISAKAHAEIQALSAERGK